jgi:extracellular factor (EF) 3-hydroxypalmitic acid methyl ester biosynthesis protein
MEVQRFLASDVPVGAEFVLLDFDDETIAYARKQLDRIQRSAALHSQVRVIKKSVNQVFKDSARSREAPTGGRFDFVYCAGLFDYMTDSFCQHLMSIFYEWVAPGGLLLATNVESRNPQRFTMSYLLDWHLFNRDANDCRKIAPPMVAGDTMRIYSDLTGVNLFIEVRKDRHDHRPASNGCAIP